MCAGSWVLKAEAGAEANSEDVGNNCRLTETGNLSPAVSVREKKGFGRGSGSGWLRQLLPNELVG